MTRPHLLISDISNHYTVTTRNKFDTLLETYERHTPNNEYENGKLVPKSRIRANQEPNVEFHVSQ